MPRSPRNVDPGIASAINLMGSLLSKARSSSIEGIFAKLQPANCTPEWLKNKGKEFKTNFARRNVSDLLNNRDGEGVLDIMIEAFKSTTLKRGQQFDREKARDTIVNQVADAALDRAHEIFEEEYQR